MTTILHRLNRWAEVSPGVPAQKYKQDGQWKSISAAEMRDRVYYLSLYLQSRGLTPQDIACTLAPNSFQWVHTELATMLVGAKSAGLYPNSSAKDIAYILNHTEARILAVKDAEFFKKIVDENGKPAVPERISLILVFEGPTDFSPKAVSYWTALAEGRRIAESGKGVSLTDLLDRLDPKAPSFMIYTSGTTGNPKGALLSQENLVFTSDLVSQYWKLPYAQGSLFSFLPLCHIAEKLQSIGVGISQRYTVSFCTKFDNVAIELPEVEPSLLLCVPRLWEKMMEGVSHKVSQAPLVRRALAKWAFGVGTKVADERFGRGKASALDHAQLAVADKLVLSKVRKALGLGRAELLASGAAALSPTVGRWFQALGKDILEDFGQTESTGVICMTSPGIDCLGTVGKPVPGVEFKLADDGEILTRGKHVFVGYFKDPENTARTLEDGWLHTGDLAEFTDKGLVRIRGRKKEILKTSGGKMVAPVPIEEEIKAAPQISQVCMVGDGRKYLAALVTLSEGYAQQLKDKKPFLMDRIEIEDDEVRGLVERAIETVNQKRAGYEQIKKFAVLSKEFSIVDGEMTPTLKMKRNVIESNYQQVIQRMYGE